jgi:hypothetical protein
MYPSKEALAAANVLVAADAPWQRELRLRQARWREHLGLPPGLVKDRALGSRLPLGDQSSNFLSASVLQAVRDAMEQPGALISAPRIFDNMLSSQPLAFNLFAELAANLPLATSVCQALWPGLLHSVEKIGFEWSPGRRDERYLGNLSAFDVAVWGHDASGQSAFVGIEVKYHEDMTQDPGSPDKPRYTEVAGASSVFRDPDAPALRARPLRQLWFDHLLALSMLGNGDGRFGRSRFVLLAPAINRPVAEVDALYRAHLADALTYERRTLEEIVAVIDGFTDEPWVSDFQRRYLRPTTAEY